MANSPHGQAHVVEMKDWQTGKLTFSERAKHLLLTGLYTDCQFLVGANGCEQEVIKAHKLYLAQSSPVFEAMLFGKMTEGTVTNEAISIPDLTPSGFKDLLQYIYSGEYHNYDLIQSMDQAMDLYYAAKKYILPGLVDICSAYMRINLCPENTCRVLEFTNFYGEEDIKEECLSLLQERTVESLAPPDFEELPESTVSAIMKEEDLNIRELELFNAVTRWAGHQCALRDVEVNGNNMRQILGEITNEIRFLTMKPKEFASSPALSGILTQEECFAISMNLNNPGSLPMPPHLSSCRDQRRKLIHLSPIFTTLPKNGERQDAGIVCLRNVENEGLILKEPFVKKMVSFVVDQAIIFKGVILAGMILADQNDQEFPELDIDCYLLNYGGYARTHLRCGSCPTLATGRVFQPIPRHESTPITYCLEFNRSVRLEPRCPYEISVSVSKRFNFCSGLASTVFCQGIQFSFPPCEDSGLVRGLIFDLVPAE